MSIVNNGSNHDAEMVEAERLFDQTLFVGEISAVNFETKSLAKDAQGVALRVQGSGDSGSDQAFLIMILERVLDDRFTGSGLAQEQAYLAVLATARSVSRCFADGPAGKRSWYGRDWRSGQSKNGS